MHFKDGKFPSGWILLRGALIRRGGDYNARLFYSIGEAVVEDDHIDVPTSVKGVINELICLPRGIKCMRFSPMGTAGEFQLSSISFTRISSIERLWRMAHRITSMMLRHSKRKRQVIGFGPLRMLTDIDGAYRAASRLRAHAPAPEYQSWIGQFDTLSVVDRLQIGKQIADFRQQPHFDLLLVAHGAEQGAVQDTLASLTEQIYRNFSCTVLAEGDVDLSALVHGSGRELGFVAKEQTASWLTEFNEKLVLANNGKWLMMLHAGDVLAPCALYRFAYEVLNREKTVMLYSDDDALDRNGQRCFPRFKPDWSMAHLRATNFIGDAVALRASTVVSAGGLDADCFRHGNYDLLLRVVDASGGGERIVHIPEALMHTTVMRGEGSTTTDWERKALRAHFARNNISGDLKATLPGCWRVSYKLLEAPPLVSIIVPTRDAPVLIRQCVESVLAKTTYPNYEIVVVDNQSTEPEALAYLEQIAGYEKVRVIRYDQPFNFSAMNNMAVGDVRGDVVCLLNNDTEVISPDWLEEMVGHLVQDKVGIVGAKLCYPDGRVQHAGDLVGVGGVANHAHAYLHHGDPGYCSRAWVAQDFSAVTAACMVTWRYLYQRLGGLDERHLPVAFNDVDYCLRMREAGYRVVWTPHAELYHHESVSRGKDLTPEKKRRARREVTYMRKRWKHVLGNDPYYNPNLSFERPDFSLSHAPGVKKPWLK